MRGRQEHKVAEREKGNAELSNSKVFASGPLTLNYLSRRSHTKADQLSTYCSRYASTNATPVVPFLPRTIAVYLPAGSERTTADSRLSCG